MKTLALMHIPHSINIPWKSSQGKIKEGCSSHSSCLIKLKNKRFSLKVKPKMPSHLEKILRYLKQMVHIGHPVLLIWTTSKQSC